MTELELVVRLLDRDEEALRALIENYGGRVRGFLRRCYEGNLTAEERQDAFNRTFMVAWRRIERYDDTRGTLGGWLIGIARNAARVILIRERPEAGAQVGLNVDPDVNDDPAGFAEAEEEGGPEGTCDERTRCLREVINGLPDLQRRIIDADLAADGQADAGRLAQAFGTTRNSIYVSRNKAHNKIREQMRRRGYGLG